MTTTLEMELATICRGVLETDRKNAQALLRVVTAIRGESIVFDRLAEELDAMAKRLTERVKMLERLEDRGVLDDTGVGFTLGED